jgi:hypothetical protein
LKALVADVAHHSHDLVPPVLLGPSRRQAASDRASVRPVTARQRLVHHRDAAALSMIRGLEEAAFDEWKPERLPMTRARGAGDEDRGKVLLPQRKILERMPRAGRAPRERKGVDRSHDTNAGKRPESFRDLVHERGDALGVVAGRGKRNPQRESALGPESGGDGCELEKLLTISPAPMRRTRPSAT